MQRIISDVLMQDYLQDKFTKPEYQLDDRSSIVFFKSLDLTEEAVISVDGRFLMPLHALKEPWSKPSWRKLPSDLEGALNLLFLSAEQKTSLRKTASSFQEAFEMAKKHFAFSYITNAYPDAIYQCAHLVASQSTINDNIQFLYNQGYDCFSILLKSIPDNVVLFLPDPEYLGCLTVSCGDDKIGAFLILDKVLRIEIGQ